MSFNRTLFCFSCFVIFLFSIIFFHHTTPSLNSSTINPSIGTALQSSFSFQLGLLSKIIKLSGVEDFVSLLLTSIVSRRYYHHKEKCDEAKWASKLISDYNVSLVFMVDLKGCGNFSSVQKAVDAVPESSSDTTLIIIDSGIYRSLSILCFYWFSALN